MNISSPCLVMPDGYCFQFIALFTYYEYPTEMHYKLYDRKGRSLMEASKSESKENIKGKFQD